MSRTSLLLYSSPLLQVHDVQCREGCGPGRHEESCPVNSVALVRRGAFVRRDRAGRHVADATRVMFFNRGEAYTMDHPLPGGDRCTALTFAADVLRGALRHPRGEPEQPFTQALQLGGPALQMAHRALLAAVQQSDALRIEECAVEILALCTQGPREARVGGAAAHEAVRLAAEAQVLIAGLFTERLTLDRLAGQLAVSPFRLCRAFRQATGASLHRHLTDLRLAAALEQLPQYRERLTELALDLGFSSHSHFTQVFRSRYGRTPSDLLAA